MAIPPFPSQDLAKLVLGYMAEEQLMTAYDEFLQASPYLDVLRNEYDRIFMTSLRHILAEYRAVKIYVETCKPFALRKRMFQCTNLLEVVKFLINNVDMNKVNAQDSTANRISSESRNASTDSKHTVCENCTCLKLGSCMCKSRQSSTISNVQSASNMELTLESSVETTALEDLPGNHVTTRKKHVKVLDRDPSMVSQTSREDNSEVNKHSDSLSTVSIEQNSSSMPVKSLDGSVVPVNVPRPMDMESTPRQELNEARDLFTNVKGSYNNPVLNVCREKVSTATTFQEFATGVGGNENLSSNIPDSSTTENLNSHAINTDPKSSEYPTCVKGKTKAHIVLKVGTIRNNQTNESSNISEHSPGYKQIQPKPKDPRITILSDIKVDKTDKNVVMPSVLNNATSTPLVQMQTITINGTPAYKRDTNCCYTKDEIMAMPTIILVPTPGPSRTPQITAENKSITTQNTKRFSRKICCIPLPKDAVTQNINPIAKDLIAINNSLSSNQNVNIPKVLSSRSLEPLTIDVTNSPVSSKSMVHESLQNPLKDANEPAMLVKTADLRNASVPKDNVIEDSHKPNTPQMLPPTRKSSSTPRRTSHVRVLDFTTPRRILQEPINENVSENGSIEVIVSRSPSLHTFVEEARGETHTEDNLITNTTEAGNTNGSTKENDDTNKLFKSNWDADLRALAVANLNNDHITKHKPRTIKKKKLPVDKKTDAKTEDKKEVKKPVVKKKAAKNNAIKKKCEEDLEENLNVDFPPTLPVKPNINIIPGSDWSGTETDKIQNKSNNDDQVETPETERLSLQNAIEAKLNLSDFLATPYKQALYDIQMETPRFLGPDLPDDIPMSDIKIMNIPTPRFLNTPKPQATPSSYSSRPTDYSSGGSYYKPDDQDYNVPQDLGYSLPENTPASTAMEEPTKENPKQKTSTKSRPVRKCTKNVSYYNSPCAANKKEIDDKTDAASTCSDTTSINSLGGNKDKETAPKTPKETKAKTQTKAQTKSEPRKRNSTAKFRKTPVKKESPKTFLKIKPRRPTPTKETISGKTKRKPESRTNKRVHSKDKQNITPVVTCAPTKSRRKSSTPRKLHCTKQFNSESSGHESPENKSKTTGKDVSSCAPDSDTDQLALRWSDEGSQDGKPKETPNILTNDTDDITKIREYIANSDVTKNLNQESSLHDDLVKRGFDIETAKIIERDLLDTPPHPKEASTANVNCEAMAITDINTVETVVEKVNESDCNTSNNLLIVPDEEEEEEEIELTVHECNEETENYITCQHNDFEVTTNKPLIKLKDTFNMEVCIEDDLTIRVRATPLTMLFDDDPKYIERPDYSYKETELAVSSISTIEKLYTPMKDPIKATCYEIFDSTLTSLDTPLKVQDPMPRNEANITEIVLEVEKLENKEQENKKRKRVQSDSSEDLVNETKRAKPETQYFINPDLHNIDIETVLYKLHGP